jgi:cytolysin-activating lysine-acyltransferase
MTLSEKFSADPGQAPQLSLNKRQIGAAASKLVAASIGDIAVVFARSPVHKHYSLADIEWMILPPVLSGQFYVAELANKETGFHAPIAVATWAFVSEEIDKRLQSDPAPRIRLRPEEWRSGDIGWIVDLAGDPRGIQGALEWLKAGPFKDKEGKILTRDAAGGLRLDRLGGLTVDRKKETE